jgi:hypothetical protein
MDTWNFFKSLTTGEQRNGTQWIPLTTTILGQEKGKSSMDPLGRLEILAGIHYIKMVNRA